MTILIINNFHQENIKDQSTTTQLNIKAKIKKKLKISKKEENWGILYNIKI